MQVNVAFNSIGFHTALILNKLRNHEQIKGDGTENAQRRAEQDKEEQEVRARLKYVRRRLADLAEFELRARGEKN